MIARDENGNEFIVHDMPRCIYNLGVNCSRIERHCSTCGWCPAVENERKKRAEEKYATIKIGF